MYVCVCDRVVVVRVQYSCGRLVTVVRSVMTAAVMATCPVSTRCLSAVSQTTD